MRFYANPAQYPTDKRNMRNLSRSVMQGNFGKWKAWMSRKDLEIFESLARDDLLRFGYQPATDCPGISTSRRIYYGMVKGPVSKSFAMLKNKKGHRDALILSRIRLKLLLGGQRQSMPGIMLLASSSGVISTGRDRGLKSARKLVSSRTPRSPCRPTAAATIRSSVGCPIC